MVYWRRGQFQCRWLFLWPSCWYKI